MNQIFRRFCCAFAASVLLSSWLAAAPGPFEKPASDTLAPVLVCPANLTITLHPGRCDTFFQYIVTVTDNEPGATIQQVSGTPPAGSILTVGKTVNLFQATDVAGNTTTCVFSVRVRHPAVPLACKETVQVVLDSACSFDLHYLDLLTGSGYGCPNNFKLEMDTILPLGNGPWILPIHTIGERLPLLGYRVTDAGTSSQCTGVIQLEDKTVPKLTCQDITTSAFANPNLLYTYPLAGVSPIVEDNCTRPIKGNKIDYSESILQGTCATPYYQKIIRIWTATDKEKNTSTCQQTILLQRHSLSEVQFSNDTSASCSYFYNTPLLNAPFVVQDGIKFPIASHKAFSTEYRDSTWAGSCDGNFSISRIWTVRDDCSGEVRRDTQLLVIQDDVGPVIKCTRNLTVNIASMNDCTGVLDLPNVVIDDGCAHVASVTAFWKDIQGIQDSLNGILSTFPTYNPYLHDTLGVLTYALHFPLGRTLVTYVAKDRCGNTGTCTSSITILDKIPPTAQCDTLLTVYLGKNGQAQVPATRFNTGSIDNCGDAQLLDYRVRRMTGQGDCSPQTVYNSWADFCCSDIGDTIDMAVRVYDLQLPTDTISSFRFAGQYGDCTARIQVLDSLPPLCGPMPVVYAYCTTWKEDLKKIDPYQFATCSTDSVSVKIDTSLLTECGNGTIIRQVSVFDKHGIHTSTCKQTVQIGSSFQFFVRFPDDISLLNTCPHGMAGATLPPQVYTPRCEFIDISYKDTLLAPSPASGCFGAIRRRWWVKNACTTSQSLRHVLNPVGDKGPVVSRLGSGIWTSSKLPLEPNGELKDFSSYYSSTGYVYDQYLFFTTVPLPPLVAAGGTTLLDNINNVADTTANDPSLWNDPVFHAFGTNDADLPEAPTELSITLEDTCSAGPFRIGYELLLDLDSDGLQETKISATQSSNTFSGQVWFGNAKVGNPGPWAFYDRRTVPFAERYWFDVKMDTIGTLFKARAVWRSDLNPLDFSPLQLPHGNHQIIWYVKNGCDIWTKKETIPFTVGPVRTAHYKISGHIRTESGTGISEVTTALGSPMLTLPDIAFTDTSGAYHFLPALLETLPYGVVPAKPESPLNGVSTYDLTLISKHILGLEPITSPYRLIAADANRSGSITTFDIVELRKLILGIYTELPNAPSWRFVPKTFVFPQPDNPFAQVFPEKIDRSYLPGDRSEEDFVGIKVGDLNHSAVAHVQGLAEDRSGRMPVPMELDDRAVNAGEVFTIAFNVKDPVAGCQFTLETPGLTVVDVEPGTGVSPDHFSIRPHALTASLESVQDQVLPFRVIFKADRSGAISEMLYLSDRITRSEAYPSQQPMPPAPMMLHFNSESKAPDRKFEIFPNQPNPFHEETLLPFYLPADNTYTTLTVFDPTGRRVFTRSGLFQRGIQSFLVKKQELGTASGVLYYRIETATDAATRKMVFE